LRLFTERLEIRYAVTKNSEDVRDFGTIILALVVAIGSLALLVSTPPFVNFGLAIIAAVCWCIWLERHPST
jgi:hypothetical protein